MTTDPTEATDPAEIDEAASILEVFSVRTPNLEDQPQLGRYVASYIRDMIMAGQIRPGSFVRIERVASALKVSATPVREALVALAQEGFVRSMSRRGFVVLPMSRRDVQDIFELIAHISGTLVNRAVSEADPQLLAMLEQIQDRMEQSFVDGDQASVEQSNFQFHRALNLAGGSPKMNIALRSLSKYVPRQYLSEVDAWRPRSNAHRLILSCLAAGDASAAQAAMENHVMRAGEQLLQHLEQRDFFNYSGGELRGAPTP